MTTVITWMIMIVAFALIAKQVANKKADGAGSKNVVYYRKKLLTQPEQVLYYKLRKALPTHNVLAQVSLTALIGIKKGDGWQTAFNKTSRKYVDFVICNPAFEVIAVIELDDSTHQQGQRIKSDAVKEIALEGAGIRVVRWWMNEVPSVEEIELLFSAKQPHPVTPT